MKNRLLTLLVLHLGLAAVMAQPVIPPNEPADQTVIAGGTATFSVNATGTPPLTNQWRRYSNATAYGEIPGATNSVLVLTNAQVPSHRFAVVVSDSTGSRTSRLARLTVVAPPSFTDTNQPASQLAEVGETVTFAVSTTGTTPLSYQWRWNDTNLPGKTSTNLVLANVQFTNAGGYSLVVTNLYGSATSRVAVLTVIPPVFTQITNGQVVSEGGWSVGCAWGDYDNDGFVDLFVANAYGHKNFLYHNNRDGRFSKISKGAIVNDAGDWRGCPWVDYDNDGFLDMFVTSSDAHGFASKNVLYRNNRDGTFTTVSSQTAGELVPGGGGTEGAVWADYDNDGALDLFLARYGVDWVFHNNGSGFFTSVTNQLIGAASEDSYYCAWADYNNDGLPDIFVSVKSDHPTNRLYKNLGGGSFEQVRSGSIATDSAYSAGPAWGDYDNDGFLDLFVANGFGGTLDHTNYLYHNNGDGTFSRMTSNEVGSVVADMGYSITSAWGDFDNDGYLDLFVSRGPSAAGANGTTNLLYRNNRDGSFSRLSGGRLGLDVGNSTCSGAWADFDNDGFLDLFVCKIHSGIGENLLYLNNGNSNAWLKVKLVGTVANRSAVGAKVRLKATVFGKSIWQLREITTGNGFNQNSVDAHFGLGDATNVETLRIEWPSGTVQELTNVAPKQILTVTEPPRLSASRTNGTPQFTLKGRRGFNYQIETSTNLPDWSPLGPLTITNQNGTAPISDTNAPGPRRFYRAVTP